MVQAKYQYYQAIKENDENKNDGIVMVQLQTSTRARHLNCPNGAKLDMK